MDIDYGIIGERLKEARLAKRITQDELSEILDVSTAYLSRIERGSANINLKRLVQICGVLNVNIGRILTGVDMKSKQYLDEELYEVLIECSPEKQKVIYNIAKLVAKANFI